VDGSYDPAHTAAQRASWTLGLRKENLDRILRAIQVQVIVAGIGKTYESLGLVGERVQPLTKRDRHHPIALTVQE
jgi:hypothetical protein